MSYAGRLVQMTGRAAPSPRPVVHEVVEHTDAENVRIEPSVRTASPAPRPLAEDHRVPPAPVAPRLDREPASHAGDTELPEVHELARIVERAGSDAVPATRRAQVLAAPVPAVVSREVVHEWLTERSDGADPLDSIGTDDEMRELLRAVRSWTSAPDEPAEPQPVETAPAVEIIERMPGVPTAPVPAAVPAPRAEDPVQVSIGNVTITIEDAPLPARRPAAVTTAAIPEGRLARHHWRGR